MTQLALGLLVLLASLTVHEAAHAWSADRLGDSTARRLGRLSLNPVVHIDPVGTLLFPLIALATGLPDIVFRGSGAPLPETFAGIAPRTVHGIVAKLLIALIALHVAAALYHHFVRRDGLLRRMTFGRGSS